VRPIYITGHRNPDTDSIASAIGYAELKRRVDPNNEYVPVRLGDTNPQTRWLLERSGAPEPRHLPHVMLRAVDVMQEKFPISRQGDPVREAGRAMAKADLELVPIVDEDGALTGVLTERALARRYVRDSLRTSTLEEAPTDLSAVVDVLEGELIIGEDRQLSGRVWVYAMDPASDSGISDGDIVVVGNRPDAQVRVIELGVSEQIKESHYGAAVALDADDRPVGLVTRSDLVAPQRRRVVLVDHAETAQSAIGIGEAEIMEILDHHHIGSIETQIPVTATFDPVGSTATLVVERFRQAGMEPSRSTAMMLLGAVMSDTVILNSATTTRRDHAVVEYLERVLAVDAAALGREMFAASSDVSDLSAQEIVTRDAKRYQVRGGQEICIAQVEVVGDRLLERREELLEALRKEREDRELALYALMVTDVIDKGTEMLVAGDVAAVARSFGVEENDSTIDLPGVMSRKKEVAPKLMTAL
jgi:manganese-dependent inorganic pyrophosphatase